jgi:hypothetical protein
LKERRKRESSDSAYFGRKFQRDDLVLFFHAAETGIYEADLFTKRYLNDDDVSEALEFLIEKLRSAPLPESGEFDELQGTPLALVVANIVEKWWDAFERYERPPRTDLIGILRTTLGSIQTRGEMNLSPRGYLDFLPGFLNEGALY